MLIQGYHPSGLHSETRTSVLNFRLGLFDYLNQVTASRPTLTPPHRLRPSNHGTHTTPGITASVNAASTNNSSNSNSNANTGNVNAQGSGSGNAASGGKNASLRDKDQVGPKSSRCVSFCVVY